jgi:AbiU2
MQQMPMPSEIEPLWTALYEEVVHLHAYWIIFEQLFAKSSVRVNLLNASAAQLFVVVQDALGTDVQLTLSKLSDPATTKGRQNATLPRLFDEVAQIGNDRLKQKLEIHLTAFQVACKPIRERRDRLIAHSDLPTILKNSNRPPVPELTRKEIEAALAALRDFMNAIEGTFSDTSTGYEHFISREDGDDLVLLLKMARRYIELQQAGRIPWDDLKQSEYGDA